MDGSILSYTRSWAAKLANRFADDPASELEVWATNAQQREAMVVKLYEATAIEHRLPKLAGEPAVVPVVRKVIANIWAQERSHTTLVRSLRVLDEQRLALLESVLGDLQGRMAHVATANGWVSSITSPFIGFGVATGIAPEFTKAFRALTPRDFFRFSHELETTAKEGYSRILELLASLDPADSASSALKFGLTGPYEFAKTLAEECFHAAVFEQLESWLEPDGLAFKDIPAQDAVARLYAILLEHLTLGSASFAPATLAPVHRPWTKSVNSASLLVSDGGLGELFSEFDVALPTVIGDPRG